nr:helix-hairpin-helix domain-containing protein [Nitrospirota bacterium]
MPVPAAPRPPVPPTPTPAQAPAQIQAPSLAPTAAPAIPAPKASIEQAKPQPSVAPVPTAPQSSGLAPVNVNTASANDMVLFLGLPKEVAERVVSNRPYKVRGELVARNVLPKATFDVIKDRITVTP